jgi:predicted RNA binding protein YcfA (HicA-like mRNA interferase family)
MRPHVVWRRLQRGEAANVRFGDLVALLRALGFDLVRVSGSHHIFAHPEIPELLNLQEVAGQAKPYQIRQVMGIVRRYALRIEE